MTYDFLVSLYNDILGIVRGLVVKRSDLAAKSETVDTARDFEVYLSCVNGTAYFYTFATYDVDVLISCGIPERDAPSCSTNPELIPVEKRDRVVKAQAQHIIDTYVEKNEYYRMLLGLPPLTPGTKFIYPTDDDGAWYAVKTDSITVIGTDEPQRIIPITNYDPTTDTLTIKKRANEKLYQLIEGVEYYIGDPPIDDDAAPAVIEHYVTLVAPLEPYQYAEVRIAHADGTLGISQYHGDPGGGTYRLDVESFDPEEDVVNVYVRRENKQSVDERARTLNPGTDYVVMGSQIILSEYLKYRQYLYITISHTDTPLAIHEYTTEQITRLDTFGELDKIKAKYPDAAYLDYLGTNAINLVQARTARPFDLLRIGDPSNATSIDLFRREYFYARRYVLANHYNRMAISDGTLYEPTIGVLMLTLCIRNIFALDEKSYLDFDEILNAILESYGLLKYFKRFPFVYKRRLVIAMDKLLEFKGTDGVLVDVCKIFSPDQDLIANRYYLMKTHKRDLTGAVAESDDPDEAYNITFLKAQIDEHDINTTEEYRVNYKAVTDNDYLWQIHKYEEDGVTVTEEYRKLMEDGYNLRMSKYIDAQAAYDLTSLVFEVCCFINMLLQSRDKLSKLILSNKYAVGTNINLENRTPSGSSSLYIMLIFLLAVLARRSGFDGNIVYDPETMFEVWGKSVEYSHIWHFNFGDVKDIIKEILDDYNINIDLDEELLGGMDFTLDQPNARPTAQSLIQNYVNNRNIFDAIMQRMNTTTDIREYQALHNIKDILFTSFVETAMFEKADGTLAQTYRELLDDLDPRLGLRLDQAAENVDELNGMAVYILEQLEDYFKSDDLHYLFMNTPSVYIELVRSYIEIALNVFKASSVQLRNVNVMFYYGDGDPVRVLEGKKVEYHLQVSDEVHIKEEIAYHYKLFLDDYVAVGDRVYIE